VNDTPVFARGFVWSALDLTSLGDDPQELRQTLSLARDAGANMIRVPGTTVYASDQLLQLCDELGILVWHDLMFANFDYPFEDASFGAAATEEVEAQISRMASRPSLAVVCGGSEVAQQAAMFGVETASSTVPFFEQVVPAILTDLDCDAVYLPSSPWGGALPFRFDRGVAHYFGVGGYRRPLADVKTADVRFASECLAIANVPEPESFDDIVPEPSGDVRVDGPSWKAGVPRDVGAEWDFDDVRDHYLAELYGVDPLELRSVDNARYMSLSRRVSGDVMQEVLGEWRRSDSTCAGALVLWLRDLVPGAGWGVLDSAGRPKAAYHLVKRLLAPLAVWSTNEGLAGLRVHAVNDSPHTFDGVLRVCFYRDAEVLTERVESQVTLAPHSSICRDVEEALGRFIDASGAYAFGPASFDLVVTSLYDSRGERRSQHLRFLHGRPSLAKANEQIGLVAEPCPTTDDAVAIKLRSRAAALGVRVRLSGFEPSDDVFDIAPGEEIAITLVRRDTSATRGYAHVTADNSTSVLHVDCRNPHSHQVHDRP